MRARASAHGSLLVCSSTPTRRGALFVMRTDAFLLFAALFLLLLAMIPTLMCPCRLAFSEQLHNR